MGRFVVEDGRIVAHRTWFKVLLNPVLRAVQFWTSNPYVIVTKAHGERVLGYGFRRMRLSRKGA